MIFNLIEVKSDLNPRETLATYYISEDGKYKIQKSFNRETWIAFFATNKDQFTLVAPPVDTKQAAIDLCCAHSLALPW